jgi:hypothetical protein
MQSAPSVLLAVLLLCTALFGQSATAAAPGQTFHVRGTITDPLEAVIRGVKVTFQNGQLTNTVTTNDVGVYEADLPFGDYTMTAQGVGFKVYRRPLFRIMSPTTAILNATLLVGRCGDMVIVNSSGAPVTDEQYRAATEHCRGEELIPIPSREGLRLELSVRYGDRTLVGSTYSYTGEKTHQYETPVFVVYNLFSLQADKVTYDSQRQTIEATGNVVAVNELGATQRANSMAFKIEDGQVALLR